MNRQPSPETKEIPSKGDLAGAAKTTDRRPQTTDQGQPPADLIAALLRSADDAARQKRQARARRGRPAQLTIALVERIAEEIGQGMPERLACVHHGASYDAWAKAKQRNAEFVLVVEQAQAKHLKGALQIIWCDLPGAAGLKWLLPRRFGREFYLPDAEVQQHVHTTNNFQMSEECQRDVAAYARRLDLGMKGGGK